MVDGTISHFALERTILHQNPEAGSSKQTPSSGPSAWIARRALRPEGPEGVRTIILSRQVSSTGTHASAPMQVGAASAPISEEQRTEPAPETASGIPNDGPVEPLSY